MLRVCIPKCHFPGIVFSWKNLWKVASGTFGNILFPVPTQSRISGLATSPLVSGRESLGNFRTYLKNFHVLHVDSELSAGLRTFDLTSLLIWHFQLLPSIFHTNNLSNYSYLQCTSCAKIFSYLSIWIDSKLVCMVSLYYDSFSSSNLHIWHKRNSSSDILQMYIQKFESK